MNKLKVSMIYPSKSACKNIAGIKLFVPETFRATLKVGDWCIWSSEHYDKSSKRDENGEVEVDGNGKPVLIDEGFDRKEITFVGTYDAVVEALNEDAIYAGAEVAVIEAAKAKVSKTYNLATASAADLV